MLLHGEIYTEAIELQKKIRSHIKPLCNRQLFHAVIRTLEHGLTFKRLNCSC